jgi:cobaltochelatase CobS
MTTAAMTKKQEPAGLPDMKVSVRQVFGIDSDLEVPAYSEVDPHVPDIDSDYRFDRATTLAILAGFSKNRRVMVTGYHGTGKSTHIEQVAARLNWPCVRVNLDSHISRIDLVGKDSIVVRDGMQVTEFRDGILPWALQHNIALVFDEYDAGRPDRPPHAARPEQGDQAASGVPVVLDRQHRRPRRYFRSLSRHPADQPGPDGPLVDRHHAELSGA